MFWYLTWHEKFLQAPWYNVLQHKILWFWFVSVSAESFGQIFSFGFGIGPKPKRWFRSYTTAPRSTHIFGPSAGPERKTKRVRWEIYHLHIFQVIQWMQNPSDTNSLRDFAEWKEKCDIKGQAYCSLPNACPLTTRELPGNAHLCQMTKIRQK